ncbi:hypothetical protein Tco_0346556, partial [Tanacetum coccineum]
ALTDPTPPTEHHYDSEGPHNYGSVPHAFSEALPEPQQIVPRSDQMGNQFFAGPEGANMKINAQFLVGHIPVGH